MGDADTLARRIVVRHREAGHLRFDIPSELCGPARAAALESGLRQVPGVYRVAVGRDTRKLSIRFDPQLADIAAVARRLFALLDELPAESQAAPAAVPSPLQTARHAVEDGVRRAAAGIRGAIAQLRRSDAPEGSLQARLQPLVASALTEKAIHSFLNDLVAFYLVKVHWDLITQRWIREPVKFSSEWLATFYLVYLLVRARKLDQ